MQHLHIAIAIVWRDGKVLVTKRPDDADHLPGLWEFPGGKCDDGELPSACAMREVQEEVGIAVKIVGEHEPVIHTYPERRITLHSFDCAITQGEPQPLQAADLRWLAPHELSDHDFPAANAQLLQKITGIGAV
ncbi:MAG: 8-oxo-dGTP diphosphatase MutT [Abitibacteriaceae bacterium]|nr:8-oxo-dGTP diphosphatase MutT [Abditibacteriaceae bacterium]